MKFHGGTCENINGELLDYEIIQHENNLITECRLKRRVVHFKKWIISTIIFTYLAAIIGIHTKVKLKSFVINYKDNLFIG